MWATQLYIDIKTEVTFSDGWLWWFKELYGIRGGKGENDLWGQTTTPLAITRYLE